VPLDPVLAGLIAGMSGGEANQPVVLDVASARIDYEANARIMTPVDQRDPVGDVQETTVPGRGRQIPVRVYQPLSATGPAPVIVWFHGGGWTIGSLDTADTVARALCHGVGGVVVSVDYRLAPEHPWPAGLEDAVAALQWVSEQVDGLGGDAARIAVGGDSSGGNLAAVVAQQMQDEGPALAGQILLYPATDLDLERADSYPSWKQNGSGYPLTTDAVRWCVETYLPAGADTADPLISPLRCADLSRLPPAVVAVAEFDLMRDQGVAYASALRKAGVQVLEHDGLGLVHGCFDMLGIVPASRTELDRIVASVRQLLSAGAEPLARLAAGGSS
jgi:acetyl esterase